MQIHTLIFDGFDELDMVGCFEALRLANLSVKVLSLQQEEVVGANGLKVRTNGVFDSNKKPDLLFVPGGGWLNKAPRGAWAEARR